MWHSHSEGQITQNQYFETIHQVSQETSIELGWPQNSAARRIRGLDSKFMGQWRGGQMGATPVFGSTRERSLSSHSWPMVGEPRKIAEKKLTFFMGQEQLGTKEPWAVMSLWIFLMASEQPPVGHNQGVNYWPYQDCLYCECSLNCLNISIIIIHLDNLPITVCLQDL